MLIYEKRDKIKFRINLSEEIIAKVKEANSDHSTLGCDSSAVSRAAAQRQHDLDLPVCFRLYPDLFDQVRNEPLEFNKEKNEYYAYIKNPEGQFNKFVPIREKVGVLMDNTKFLGEKQVFSAAFYDTTTQLFDKVLTNLEQQIDEGKDVYGQLMDLYLILDRLLFDLVSNSRNL